MHLAFVKVSFKMLIEELSIILFDNRPMTSREKQKKKKRGPEKRRVLKLNYIIHR